MNARGNNANRSTAPSKRKQLVADSSALVNHQLAVGMLMLRALFFRSLMGMGLTIGLRLFSASVEAATLQIQDL